jgi:hypothetical protein
MARRQGHGERAMPAPTPRAPAARCPAPLSAHPAPPDQATWTAWIVPPGAASATRAPAAGIPAPPGAPPCPTPPGAPSSPPDPETWWFDPASAPAAPPDPATTWYVGHLHLPASYTLEFECTNDLT